MSWQKVKLGDLCTIEKGTTGIQKAILGEYPLVVTAEERKSHNEYQFDDDAVIIPLVSGTGHGHASIKRLHFQSGKFALGSILCAVIPKDKSVLNAEYLFRFLNLNKERELVDRMKGMANVSLPIKEIAKIEIPLPSLEEQIEFVEKYSVLESDSEDISFELEHQLDLIKQLRQAFLREAMQGKLVKSTNTAATGQQLLEKIKAEKAQLIAEKKLKKEKELFPITDDEIPFEIPGHWAWCRLGEIAITFTGNTINERDKSIKYSKITEGLDYVGTKDVKFDGKGINYNTGVKIPFNDDKFKTTKENSILMCIEGGSSGKKYAMTNKEICFGNKLLASEINSNLSPFFYYKYYHSQLFSNEFIDKSKGLRGGVSINQFREIIAPVPPLHEQEQIVVKLDELMTFCDGLEQSIKESQRYNEILLQQVLREALQPKTETNVVTVESRKLALRLKTVLGAHIVDVCNTTDFGRVKFQKLLFLTEYHCKIDFDSHYVQKAAGPHDDVLIKSIEGELIRQRFFEVKQENSDLHRVRYTKLPNANQINSMLLENFKEESVKVNNLLMKMRTFNWEECEVIATIYAVWNNRLLKGQTITDESLFEDFMAWSSRKSSFNKEFYKKLFWMREQNIIPDGWGDYVDKPAKRLA